jgi:hypothetical protein
LVVAIEAFDDDEAVGVEVIDTISVALSKILFQAFSEKGEF